MKTATGSEEWGKLLNDVPAASAILDRLLHYAQIIPINGRSYRLQSKAKRSATPERSAFSSSSPSARAGFCELFGLGFTSA